MIKRIRKNSSIIIVNELGVINYDSLTSTYKPILGKQSYSLYTTLINWKFNDNTNVEEILNLEKIKLSEFIEGLNTLEALKLTERYYHDDIFLIKINQPLSKRNFLNTTLLVNLLVKNTSLKYVNNLKETLFDYSKFNNITGSFKSVFNINGKLEAKTDSMELISFDFNKLVKNLYVTNEITMSEDFVNELKNIIILKNLSLKETKKLVLNSLDKNNSPSIVNLRRNVYNEQFSTELNKIYHNNNEIKNKYGNAPYEFYEQITGLEPAPHILNQMEWALKSNLASTELLNLAMQRSLETYQNVNMVYVNKVLKDWEINKINSIEAAKKRIKEFDARKNKVTAKKASLENDFTKITTHTFNDELL